MRDAPAYLSINKNLFNAEVRPHLIEIPIGEQGIAFDRLDLDAWADDYIARNGRKPNTLKEGDKRQNAQPISARGEKSGTSTRKSGDMDDFTKALELSRLKKRNATS